MRHLTEEEIWEHGCSPGALSAELRAHVRACEACRSECDDLEAVIEVFRTDHLPEREASDAAQLWLQLRDQLPAYGKQKVRWWSLPSTKLLVSIAACAILISAGVWGNRLWQRGHQGSSAPVAGLAPGRDLMVRNVSDEHLERCERMLIQLNHARQDDVALRREADDLLADNRLLQQSTSGTPDRLYALVLDQLGHLLTEVAHDDSATNGIGLEHLRQDMNTEGLLFQIRIMRGHAQNRI